MEKDYRKKYYAQNREKCLAATKAWQAAHPERMREMSAKSRLKRKEKISKYYIEWYAKNGRNRTDTYTEKNLEWRQLFPEKDKIQHKFRKAVEKGEISRPESCPKCGRKAKIQAHHIDYDHYTHFIWLCASCHKKEHNHPILKI
jgi:hypothetical protein